MSYKFTSTEAGYGDGESSSILVDAIIKLTRMDRWALYTAGKISKPTRSPKLLRLEPLGDFVIESMDNHSLEGSELYDLSGPSIAVDSVATEVSSDGHCSELAQAGLISCSSQVINQRREKQWREICRPGAPPLVTLQAAVGGFALGVIATVTSLVLFWR